MNDRQAERGHVQVSALNIRLGQGRGMFTVIEDLNLEVTPGSFVCILGPSGCGKSTLLGALAGHLSPQSGELAVDGERVIGPSPARGMVFQQHTLLPWRSIIDNVAFGLKMQGVPKHERYALAREMLNLVGLEGVEDLWPKALSGGMQQRVEIARVLINRPRILLMDEPFGALDAQTRLRMQELLMSIWEQLRTTVIFVTHDIDEALFLADRVLVMSARPGRFIEDVTLDFVRPRHPESLLTSASFAHLKRHCLALLRHGHELELPRLSPLGLVSADSLKVAL